MDREIPAGKIKQKRAKRLIRIGGALVLVIAAVYVLTAVISPSVDRQRLRVAVAEVGPIEASVTATGTVMPEYEQVITSPVQSEIKAVLLKSGDPVKAGESILRLDKEAIQTNLRQLTDELELQNNKKEQFTNQLKRQEIDIQARYDIKEMQTQFVGSQFERVAHLYEIGGATKEQYDQAELNYQIAQRELEQVATQMSNQQESLEADLRELDIQIRIQQNRIREIERNLGLADATADRGGVITWINEDIGAAVRPGDIVARVADLGSFRVEATISDVHADKLRVGGPITVRVNEDDLPGHISNIQPAVQNGIMTFVVELDEKSNKLLRSNLRVDVFVITAFSGEVTRVENGPFFNGKNDQRVFVLRDGRAYCKTVDIGASNHDFVELRGDITPGDTVIISDMSEYRHLDEVAVSTD